MARWDDLPLVKIDQIEGDPFLWFRGYFRLTHQPEDRWRRRDFDELRRRDLAVLALGDVAGKRILDVACGTGLYLATLAMMGADVSGQDISESSIRQAALLLDQRQLRARLEVGDATRLLFDDGYFDGVISGDFVEHITPAQKDAFFREVFRVLKPGGTFVIKTPNQTYLWASTWLKRLGQLVRGRSPLGIHIAHTRQNPDTEHHGLTTYRRLRRQLLAILFHDPSFIRQPLSKKPLPESLQYLLPRVPLCWPLFNRDLIVVVRKPIFLGFFP